MSDVQHAVVEPDVAFCGHGADGEGCVEGDVAPVLYCLLAEFLFWVIRESGEVVITVVMGMDSFGENSLG